MEFVRKRKERCPDLTWVTLEEGERFPLLVYKNLEETGLVRHGFTTRMGGVSKGIFSELNLSYTRGDDPEAVTENFYRTAKALGVDPGKLVLSDQTHTTNVRKVTAEDAGKGFLRPLDYTDVDGLITDVPGLTLCTFFADCVPLFFLDPVKKAIGMSHSGWRGTVGRMGAQTLSAMHQAYGTDPETVICAIGPSICQECYEVSADVAEAFQTEFPGHETEILRKKSAEKYQLDLWKANEIILLEAGIKKEHLMVTDICTCCNPTMLFSHRASHGKRGNLGGFICLR